MSSTEPAVESVHLRPGWGGYTITGVGSFTEPWTLDIRFADETGCSIGVLVPDDTRMGGLLGLSGHSDWRTRPGTLLLMEKMVDDFGPFAVSDVAVVEGVLDDLAAGRRSVEAGPFGPVSPAHLREVVEFLRPRIAIAVELADGSNHVAVREVDERLGLGVPAPSAPSAAAPADRLLDLLNDAPTQLPPGDYDREALVPTQAGDILFKATPAVAAGVPVHTFGAQVVGSDVRGTYIARLEVENTMARRIIPRLLRDSGATVIGQVNAQGSLDFLAV